MGSSTKIILFFIFTFTISFAVGQSNTTDTTKQRDSTEYIQIIQSDVFRRVKKDSSKDLNILVGHVIMKQNYTLFYCDSAIQDTKLNQFEAFGNIHINDADSVHTYSQYIKYLGDTRIATLKKKVKLTDGKGVLTTENLEYDLNAKMGTYLNGGKVVNGESVLTSKEGIYYADTKDVYFQKNVKLVDPDYTLATDTLLYNLNSEVASFVAATTINDGRSRIRTRSGFYDLKQGRANFKERPIMDDSTQVLIADKIDYDKISGIALAEGNVFYRDSAQGVSMLSGAAVFNNLVKDILSYKSPVMILRQDKDSLFIAADSLYSAFLPKDTAKKNDRSDTLRYFNAFHHVRMFSDSLQGKCDSLYYSAIDSVFRFFTEPVLWTRGSQISGDTLILITKNKKADTFIANENGFSINKTNEGLFNQLRGNVMTGKFTDGEIDYVRAKGNSESLYYLQDDDSAYVGMDYTQSDAISFKFINRELKRITWVNGATGTTYPFSKIPEDKKELRNFKWLEALRPKSVGELFGR
jgi:lipopolysaccharide export system protein LptA